LHVYLRSGLGPMHAAAAGPMANVTRALGQAPDSDVRAIAIYVASLMAPCAGDHRRQGPSRSIGWPRAQRAHPEAAMLFAGACAVCHEPGAPMMQQGRPHLAWGTPLHEDNAHDTVRIILKGLARRPAPRADDAGLRRHADDRRCASSRLSAARFTDKPPWPDVDARGGRARRTGEHK
jgi:nicotinate dehydrogenase subunit B